MKKVILGLMILMSLSSVVFSATIVKNKLSIAEIRASSILAVRAMYNKKKNVALRVSFKTKGYASCELYDKGQKGTCSVQFPGREEVITKCGRVTIKKGRQKIQKTRCYATNLLFFFPNAKASKTK